MDWREIIPPIPLIDGTPVEDVRTGAKGFYVDGGVHLDRYSQEVLDVSCSGPFAPDWTMRGFEWRVDLETMFGLIHAVNYYCKQRGYDPIDGENHVEALASEIIRAALCGNAPLEMRRTVARWLSGLSLEMRSGD